ncbi:restriction endonuclease HpaI [Candidatus Nitromaritima sp. SCGC AAA799-C22]|nr:restriction endonuclease HpaI [Candidatus Nitromaritima sp. SCGC AAA799-C22]
MIDDRYEGLKLKIPKESDDYQQCSQFVTSSIDEIIGNSIKTGRNKIIINTNLRHGIPMENVNKIAGPFVEAWAHEVFIEVLEDENNKYRLINVEAGERLNMADVILQFKRERKHQTFVTGSVDVKATSQDIENSGKSPNITSYARIRTMYLKDPDYIFVILSLKHKVLSQRDPKTELMMGVMEVIDFNAYDLKYLSSSDISYNPALGSGQLQVRDIHYVTIEYRDVWQFCQLLDGKFLNSKKGFDVWMEYAVKNEWIKDE